MSSLLEAMTYHFIRVVDVPHKFAFGTFRAAVYDENNRVCWGPLQTREYC